MTDSPAPKLGPAAARGGALRGETLRGETLRGAALAAATARPPHPDPIGDPASQVSNLNLANALTLLRIVLVPVFALALLRHHGVDTTWRVLAGAVFVIASVTDRIDGEVARRRHLVTELGKLADPIADKALIGTAVVGLSLLGDLTWWVTVVILVRELAVTGLRFWVIRHGVLPASRGGKVKTLIQAVAIGFYVFPFTGAGHVVAVVVMVVAVALTVITGVDYVARAVALRRTGRDRAALVGS